MKPNLLLLSVAALAVIGCQREKRTYQDQSPYVEKADNLVVQSDLHPGLVPPSKAISNKYEESAYAASEGQKLYQQYHCNGCHFNGGGGIGPPLMDDQWIYGSSPENIYNTIVQGRPNGMPSFAGKIPTPQVWMLVAYVRSLSALNTTGARSSRSDHMMMYPGSNSLQDPVKPKQAFHPPASEMP
jgi:cytochrome c oxidase cbb3-type subunit 3